MGLREQVSHAWRGARVEVQAQRGALQQLRRALRLLLLVARELRGTLQLAPYAMRAARCRREAQRTGRLTTARYGEARRNSVDVYLPPGAGAGAAPVVVFINGGVWSAGDPWQFAPLGRSLSDAGAVVCVCEYTLYPDGLVPTMVAEVQAAIEWAQRSAAQYGGDAARVTVLAHSAGAHLAASAVLARARAPPPQLPPLHALVGMAGVYHVRQHFAYETQRGVQSISTMEAAMGGQAAFDTHSPCLTLHATPTDVAARLPPVVLMGSEADSTVPWQQGEALLEPLLARGATACHLVYSATTHTHFATGWEYGAPRSEAPLLGQPARGPRGESLMAHAQDVVAIITARAPLANLPPRLRAPTSGRPRAGALPVARACTTAGALTRCLSYPSAGAGAGCAASAAVLKSDSMVRVCLASI